MPKLPAHCLNTFVKNYPKYVEMNQEKYFEIPENITRILENVHIYKNVLNMQKLVNIYWKNI